MVTSCRLPVALVRMANLHTKVLHGKLLYGNRVWSTMVEPSNDVNMIQPSGRRDVMNFVEHGSWIWRKLHVQRFRTFVSMVLGWHLLEKLGEVVIVFSYLLRQF